ncbi:MAG: ribonuclease R, partial [Planctomycetes bacterium RBG_16_64_10]
MSLSDLERNLLAHVSHPDYRPVKSKAIAKALGMDPDGARDLQRSIKTLVEQGKLAYGPNQVVSRPATTEVRDVTGIFRRMAGGYGFVRPAVAESRPDQRQDIHVAARNAHDASTGDTVLVRLHRGRRRPGQPGPSGAVVQVIQRDTHRFVGTYFERAGRGLVQVDGKLFAEPILVGDPGAKDAQPNDLVVLEMVRFPSHVHEGEGVIVDVLGPRGAPGVDTRSIIEEFDLPREFPEDALMAARQEAEAFDESIDGQRVNLAGAIVVTIDPEDARDFDDAISLTRRPHGHWRLGVHIADVSHFVRPRTVLDREARDRATSVYLPDQVIPMLPEIISNNLASLQPGHIRYCMTVLMDFTADGLRTCTEVHKTAIKSRRRFTYEEVDDYLNQPATWRGKLPAGVASLLDRMHELAMILRRRRFERGCLELSMPEVKIDLDGHGRVTGAHVLHHTTSHQIIEEFMLAANEAVANRLHEGGWGFLRRIHAAPDPRKLTALHEFVKALEFPTDSLESRFAIQALLDKTRGLPQQHAIHYAVLRSMQKAVYSPAEEQHYALASDCYCHFTSPIRRYPDLTVHRMLAAVLAGTPPVQDTGGLVVLGDHCSEREQRAESAERELTKLKLLDYLSQRIGTEMDGIITGVEEIGLFVQGVELPAEGLVHVSSLADDYYRFDRTTHTLAGYRSGNSYRLGDAVRV